MPKPPFSTADITAILEVVDATVADTPPEEMGRVLPERLEPVFIARRLVPEGAEPRAFVDTFIVGLIRQTLRSRD